MILAQVSRCVLAKFESFVILAVEHRHTNAPDVNIGLMIVAFNVPFPS